MQYDHKLNNGSKFETFPASITSKQVYVFNLYIFDFVPKFLLMRVRERERKGKSKIVWCKVKKGNRPGHRTRFCFTSIALFWWSNTIGVKGRETEQLQLHRNSQLEDYYTDRTSERKKTTPKLKQNRPLCQVMILSTHIHNIVVLSIYRYIFSS